MFRSFLNDLNSVQLKYYPFMVNLHKFSGSCNCVDDLSIKTCVPSITKDVNVKVFNMITNRTEVTILVKHISCDFKCKFNSTTFSSNQKME